MKRVVITGMGALTPLGNNVTDYWNALVKGTSGAAKITKFDSSKFKTKFACELKNFDPRDFIGGAEIRRNDPYVHYALITAAQAIAQAQLDFSLVDTTQAGIIWGSGNGGITTFEQQTTEFNEGDGTPQFNPFFIPKILGNMASGIVSIKYGLRGINYTNISACASANAAIMDAVNYIRWGKARVMIAGGSDAPITKVGIGGFNAMKALSTRNDDPAGASRPFDKDRDGFVMGEGAGALILEDLDHAIKRGAPILAEVVGTSMTSDAYHLSSTHPEGEGALRGMKLALEEANLSPNDIDYINAHATSTSMGDISETIALAELLKANTNATAISGTKSMTGHLLGAAGAIEGVAAVMSILEGKIPPTINTKTIDENIPSSLNLVCNQAIDKEVSVAMSNTFGFGGHNSIVIFKKYVA